MAEQRTRHYIVGDTAEENWSGRPVLVQGTDNLLVIDVRYLGATVDLSGVRDFILVSQPAKSGEPPVTSGGELTGEGQVTVTLGRSEVAHPGTVDAQLKMYGADGGLISTTTFEYTVQENVDDGSIPSETQKTYIELFLERGHAVLDEAGRSIARLEGLNEQAQETLRQSQQALTEVKQTQVEVEGLQTEMTQLKTETQAIKDATDLTRQQTETVKTETENVRSATEAERALTETARLATETATQQAQDATAGATASAKEADASAARADMAAQGADASAQAATTAAQRASTEADKASTATGKSVAATEAANKASVYANTQGARAEKAADDVTEILSTGPVQKVNGQTGIVELTGDDIGPYGGKIEFRYNAAAGALDLVMLP